MKFGPEVPPTLTVRLYLPRTLVIVYRGRKLASQRIETFVPGMWFEEESIGSLWVMAYCENIVSLWVMAYCEPQVPSF